jgi:hypothetical protein
MRLDGWLSKAALSLFLGMFLLGTTALVQAQDGRDENKPAQPEASNPAQQDDKQEDKDVKPSKPDNAKPLKQDDNRQNTDNPVRSDEKPTKDEKPAKEDRSNQQPAAQMQGNANGGQHGGHIPDDKFRSNFGRKHTFRMQQPTVVQGTPTFQYGGYSFTLVDAWPVGWAYTDQCYIDYIDGEYFLFDLAHPGVRLAIVVAL